MPTSNSNAQIAAQVRSGGNLPGDMVFDPNQSADEMVRPKTAEEKRLDTEAATVAAELANEAAQPKSGGANVPANQ